MKFPASTFPEFLESPVTQQKKLSLIIVHLIIIIIIIIISSNPTKSQSLSSSPTDDPSKSSNFQPSLSVIVGVLAILLSLTFLLLVYSKYWHTPSSLQYLNQENFGELPPSVPRASGIDKTLIESLPVFQFSTLKGWRSGLECAICLSRFEDIEILRLLPKCKHAFHIGCVDRWLEKHSGCPLCRCKVSQDDMTLFANSSSLRFLKKQLAGEGSNLELFVEREGSRRFGSGRSVEKIEDGDINVNNNNNDQEMLHKFNHRIIISDYENDLMGKNRWSSLSSSDLLFLKSEMITSFSSNRFQDDQELILTTHIASRSSNKLKSGKLVEQRSMSEIVVHPRFLGVEESSNKEGGNCGEISAKEERLKRLWVSIARRTIQWFANRDDQQSQINTRSQA